MLGNPARATNPALGASVSLRERARSLKTKLTSRRTERKTLRGPASLQYALADTINALHPTLWAQASANGGFFMSLPYLQALEPVLPENIRPRYALVLDAAGEPIAAIVMQLVSVGLSQVRAGRAEVDAPKAAHRWLSPLQEKLSDTVTQQVLVCGNLLIYGQYGVGYATGADPALIWHAVAEALFRTRQAEKLKGRTHFVLIKDVHAPFTAHAKRLEQLSYRYVETEPNMVLALNAKWKTYDDYLASLASKYRSSVRNSVLKPIEQAGCIVETIADVGPHTDRLYALYKSVQVKAKIRPFLLPPEYFAALQAAAGARFRCTVIRQADSILGFLISVADGPTAIAYHIGFARDAAETLPIYLRLLHAGVADAIALGCTRIAYGRTALAPKATLGAKPETYGVLMRHRQPIINKAIKHLLMGIEHDDAPERNPFKGAVTDDAAA
jgi:hypothetical protein